MSAVITFLPHPDGAQPDGGHPDGDHDLVAELARSVGRPGGPGNHLRLVPVAEPDVPIGRRGHNDLVSALTMSPAARRASWAVSAVALIVVFVLVAIVGQLPDASVDGDLATSGTTMLQAGDTLWDIAAGLTPAHGDVRATLADLMAVNDFDTANLPVGTLVQLPASG